MRNYIGDKVSKSFNLIIMSLLAVGSIFVLNTFTATISQPTGAVIAVQSGAITSAILLLVAGALIFHVRKA